MQGQSFTSEEARLLNKPQAARRLGVCARTLDSWIAARRIPYVKIARSVRFIPNDLEQFILDHRIG
jgi:excisionase family DNA binding protein